MAQDSMNDAFTFTWCIENFSMCPQKEMEKLQSPEFKVAALDKTMWRLWLYPKGDDSEADSHFLSAYIHWIGEREEFEEITIAFRITLIASDSKALQRTLQCKSCTFKRNGTSMWGFKNFASLKTVFENKNVFLPEDILTVRCCMWRVPGEKDAKQDPVDHRHSFSLTTACLGTKFSSGTEEVSSVLSDNVTHTEHSPTHCTVHTRIPVERRVVKWTIKAFSTLQSKQKMTVSVASGLREKSALLLTCYLSGDLKTNGRVRIDIQRKDKELKRMYVKCKVSVLDITEIVQEFQEDERFFGKGYEVWSFPPIIKLRTLENNKSTLLSNDDLSLRCEFLIAYAGKNFAMRVGSIKTNHSTENDDLRSKLTQLLINSKELSDVAFLANGHRIAVHKAIICAQSPVFLAMFTRDTEEKRTGVINITDVDAETLLNMVNFMYQGQLKELEQEEAMKLYSAADKYEILTLKEQCASSLKYNLCISNVCDVLSLADMHQDIDLLKFVHDFLYVHSKEVFQSDEWEILMEKNVQLTGKTMLEILKKNADS